MTLKHGLCAVLMMVSGGVSGAWGQLESSPVIPGPAVTVEQKAAAGKMVAAAEGVMAEFKRINSVVAPSPELMESELEWSRTLIYAQLTAYPDGPERRRALEQHLQQAKEFEEQITALSGLDVWQRMVPQGAFVVAEAKYLILLNQAPRATRIGRE